MAAAEGVAPTPRSNAEGAEPERGLPEVRILHTSDLHLDGRFVGISDPQVRARRRRSHRDVIRRIVDLAKTEDVHLLLICGDLFDESTFQFETVFHVIEQFRRLRPGRVFIAPGLADGYHPASPYSILDWGDNVHIFKEYAFSSVTLPDLRVTVYGVAADRERLEANPLEHFHREEEEGVHVAMAFGSNVDRCPEGADTPFPFRETDRKASGVHYLALGGYHAFQKFGRDPVGCYPGMPEGTGFDEVEEKVVALVRIGPGGVVVERRQVAENTFLEVAVDVTGLDSLDAVVRAVEVVLSRKDLENTMTRVRLKGNPAADLAIDCGKLVERIQVEKCQLVVVDETQTAPEWSRYSADSTFTGEWVRTMQKKVDSRESARHEKVRDYGLGALRGDGDLRLRKPPPP